MVPDCARHGRRYAYAAMSTPLEDYALLGDRRTAALVSRDGSIDWWCVPRFDSGACFAALLGSREHGRFLLAPVGAGEIERHYRPQSLVLETEHATPNGTVRVTDCLATAHRAALPRAPGRRVCRAAPRCSSSW